LEGGRMIDPTTWTRSLGWVEIDFILHDPFNSIS
jgi:hypothetical protein